MLTSWDIQTVKCCGDIRKATVFKYFLKSALNFAFSFLRIVKLCNKMLKMLCQHKRNFFEKKKLFDIWSVKMMLISCINIVYQSIRISGVSATRLREFNCILLKLVTISLSTLLVSASVPYSQVMMTLTYFVTHKECFIDL